MKKLVATLVLVLTGCGSLPMSDLEANGRAAPIARDSEAIDVDWGLVLEGRRSKPPGPPEPRADKSKSSETTRP